MRELALIVSQPQLREDLLHAVRDLGYRAIGIEREALRAGDDRTLLVEVATQADIEAIAAIHSGRPGTDIVALGVEPGASLAMLARRAGARAVLRMPFAIDELERVLREPETDPQLVGGGEFLTEDPRTRALLAEIARAASSNATIRLHGESGTGKDLVARLVHRHSPRGDGPLVVVNCAGLSETLAESELFGHVAGAFTGAIETRPGQIASASGGSLVLDQVSELAAGLQPKLLRVLQEREITPVGARGSVPVDLRVIATSQRDLQHEVENGRFREDLYFRLDVIAFELPPLRERLCDLPLLAGAMLDRFARARGCEPPRLSSTTIDQLAAHPFPGNVRELENMMRRATILFSGREIDAGDLLSRSAARALPQPGCETLNLREIEKRAVLRALAARDGNRTQAARALGISVRTLRNKIRRYGLEDPGAADRAVCAGSVSV